MASKLWPDAQLPVVFTVCGFLVFSSVIFEDFPLLLGAIIGLIGVAMLKRLSSCF